MQTQNQYSIPVIDPAFELLKKSSALLHFIAATAIFINALYEWQTNDMSRLLCICQMVIATDILVMIFITPKMLTDAPKANLLFRFMEAMVLSGVAANLAADGYLILSMMHVVAALGYFSLLHREARVIKREAVNIQPTGITLPNLVKDAEIGWHEIKTIIPKYHSIIIETLRHKKIEFNLRQNLKIDELEQIDEFCRKHLVNG